MPGRVLDAGGPEVCSGAGGGPAGPSAHLAPAALTGHLPRAVARPRPATTRCPRSRARAGRAVGRGAVASVCGSVPPSAVSPQGLRPQVQPRGASVPGTRRAGGAGQGHCAAAWRHVRASPPSRGPRAPPPPPGRHRARGPGHPPGQPRLIRSPGAGACDLSLRTPPRHAEERCSLNRPTCPVRMTEGGDAGVRSATRPLWTAEPAGGAGPVEGLPRAKAPGGGGRRSCPRCDRSSADAVRVAGLCQLAGGVSSRTCRSVRSPGASPQKPGRARGERARCRRPRPRTHCPVRLCLRTQSPLCPLSCPRERVCEMSAFHNSCALVWFVVRDPA